MKNPSIAAAALAALAGCARPYALPPIPLDHPASTGAAETPLPPRSVAFAEEGSTPVSGNETSNGHGGHGAHGSHGAHGGHR